MVLKGFCVPTSETSCSSYFMETDLFLIFSSRVLAGVLPPAGHIFENDTSLIFLDDFPNFF